MPLVKFGTWSATHAEPIDSRVIYECVILNGTRVADLITDAVACVTGDRVEVNRGIPLIGVNPDTHTVVIRRYVVGYMSATPAGPFIRVLGLKAEVVVLLDPVVAVQPPVRAKVGSRHVARDSLLSICDELIVVDLSAADTWPLLTLNAGRLQAARMNRSLCKFLRAAVSRD
jgi:hypothetical protein